MSVDNLFIEQAEYLEAESFLEWTSEHPDENLILKKLSQGGAKLLVGPRGCGKTTLLLKAYYSMCSKKGGAILPVYVNFKNTLRLEPLYKTNANAMYWFNQWMLFKIYQGIFKCFDDSGVEYLSDLDMDPAMISSVVSGLELGNIEYLSSNKLELSVIDLELEIERILMVTGKTRCVLLLDDAAHAFSMEQQRDFFELFRSIKSRLIAPKAAIYPGVTTYSASFQAGHDAEEIDVWIRPSSARYLDFMRGLLRKRLPKPVFSNLEANAQLFDLMLFAAFGLPRALLNMVRDLEVDDEPVRESDMSISLNSRTVFSAVSNCYSSTMKVYQSIGAKLPIYKDFVTAGEGLCLRAIEAIKEYNRNKDASRQSVSIAIRQPMPQEISKVLGFLQYSGLVLSKSKEVSRGEKGVFELYDINYAALIDKNAIAPGKAKNVANIVEALKSRHPHEFTRATYKSLIGNEELSAAFTLSLPPCQNCNTLRINESQKFCHNCGSALTSASLFESLVESDISELPLTEKRVMKIKEHSRIQTVKDILMDTDNSELRKVPRIGPAWAERIQRYAEEFIG